MDLATIAGLLIAAFAILGGNALEGGHLSSIIQPTAGLIVLGGTAGAVAVQFPGAALKRAFKDVVQVFKTRNIDNHETLTTLVALAQKARREGLVSMEADSGNLTDEFMRRGLDLAVDGTDPKALREALEIELSRYEEDGEASAKVFEAGGGYAPTVGILGAVLGLIHVMENLSDPSKLGSGIAVAFVATVYGVGAANLVFLPMAGKLKMRHREHIVQMELVIEGLCAIASGEKPAIIERKLSAYARNRREGESRTAARLATNQA